MVIQPCFMTVAAVAAVVHPPPVRRSLFSNTSKTTISHTAPKSQNTSVRKRLVRALSEKSSKPRTRKTSQKSSLWRKSWWTMRRRDFPSQLWERWVQWFCSPWMKIIFSKFLSKFSAIWLLSWKNVKFLKLLFLVFRWGSCNSSGTTTSSTWSRFAGRKPTKSTGSSQLSTWFSTSATTIWQVCSLTSNFVYFFFHYIQTCLFRKFRYSCAK